MPSTAAPAAQAPSGQTPVPAEAPHPAAPSEPSGDPDDRPTSHEPTGAQRTRRGVARWPLACLALAGLLGAGGAAWSWTGDMRGSIAQSGSAPCNERVPLHVAAPAGADGPLEAAAQRWQALDPVVQAHCIDVHTHAEPPEATLDVLTGEDSSSAVPALWIAPAGDWIDELDEADGERILGEPELLARDGEENYTIVRIHGEGVDNVADRAAQQFRDFLQAPQQRQGFGEPAGQG